MRTRKRRLPIPQHEFPFSPQVFNLIQDTGLDGERISRERAEVEKARRRAEAAQTEIPMFARLKSMTTTTAKPIGAQWRGIFFDGPQPDLNPKARKFPSGSFYVGNEDGDPVSTVYHCHKFKSAEGLAKRMARDRRLNSSTKPCRIEDEHTP